MAVEPGTPVDAEELNTRVVLPHSVYGSIFGVALPPSSSIRRMFLPAHSFGSVISTPPGSVIV